MERDERLERIPGQERLRRARRLRSPRDFQRARKSRRLSGSYVTLSWVRQIGEAQPARVGFIAGKRVGNAVVRNRVKRRLREAVRRLLVDVPSGWDLVFSARPEAAGADYGPLAAEARTLLDRAGLLPASNERGIL